jgi:hypothetical protein
VDGSRDQRGLAIPVHRLATVATPWQVVFFGPIDTVGHIILRWHLFPSGFAFHQVPDGPRRFGNSGYSAAFRSRYSPDARLFCSHRLGYNRGHKAILGWGQSLLKSTSTDFMQHHLQQHDLLGGRSVIGALFALQFLAGVSTSAADEIILRNLKIIEGQTVESFDADGVRFGDGTVYGWDRIEQGTVAADQQAEFDAHLKDLGTPLYLIRQRLRVEDYQDLLPHAVELYPRYRDRRSRTSYMVIQAKMWAHLAHGEREAALEPFLRCYELLRDSPNAGITDFPGTRRLQFDPVTGLTPELTPIWFDSESAREQIGAVYKAIQAMRQPRPEGIYIYYATLAIAAGQVEKADPVLAAIKSSSGPIAELKLIALAQSAATTAANGTNTEMRQLAERLDALSARTRPLALYCLGTARLTEAQDRNDRQAGVLDLLRIPAHYGNHQPELAAAALYRVATELKAMEDERGSVAVRNELLDRFSKTHFAQLARSPIEK